MNVVEGKTSSTHDLYFIWKAMWSRCYRQNNPEYKNYGGRGIGVCERWKELKNFVADMGPRGLEGTLDRIDNNSDYTPKNCRWATPLEQMKAGRGRRRINNTSGVIGVARNRTKWEAYATVNYKKIPLYYGPSLDAAIKARKTWELSNV